MRSAKKIILIVMFFSAAVGPVCWSRTDHTLSGRELLRAVRQISRRSERRAPGSRGAAKTARTTRRSGHRNHPTAKDLLDKYAQTQDKLQSFIIKSRASVESLISSRSRKPDRSVTECEFRFDGERMCLRAVGPTLITATGRPIAEGDYSNSTCDGSNYYRFVRKSGHKRGVVRIYYGGPQRLRERASEIIDIQYPGCEVMGYFYGDNWGDGERVDSVLRKAKSISVRDRTEFVGRSQCYVIDAVSKRGRYTIWIDPEHGYNIAKAEVVRGPRENDLVWGEFYKGRAKLCYASVQNVRFKKIDGVWVPVEAYIERRSEMTSGNFHYRNLHHKRTEVILNPDHEALKSFVPDDIPPGTEVKLVEWLVGASPERDGGPDLEFEDAWEFRWQPKAKFVVDESCRLVRNDPNKHMLPIVKVLGVENLVEDFQPEPSLSKAEGKHIVLCFWDMRQEQSQQLLLNLRDRQQVLAQKGVLLIAVEASGAQTDKVHSWTKENKLKFPVGTFYSRFERLLSARKKDLDDRKKKTVLSNLVTDLQTVWRIEKLPWLILTDRERVVTAEGFGLEEVDEKIKEATDAER